MPGEDTTRTEPGRASAGTEDTLAAPLPETEASPALAPVDEDRYQRGREIARGGMGRIIEARDARLGRPVAIKELIRPDPALAARFEREALITARLQHPAIVSLYEAGRWPSGEPFYAMKLVAGRSLKAVIASAGTLDERLALLPHIIAIADALAYAHAQRIVHRDLKPANVLVGDYGEAVLIDWGLAKDLSVNEEDLPLPAGERSSGDLTTAGSVMGTPAFMAPEQAAGEPVDERADVYALGAILYHLLAGAMPYADSVSDDPVSLVREGPPTPLARRQPAAPPELVAIVERAMARDPGARYPSARELAEELRRFQTGRLVTAHRYSRRELARRWLRRHRTALSVAVAVVTAAGVVGGVSLQRILRERARATAAERRATERADRLTLAEARAALGRDPLRVLSLLAELSPGSRLWSAARIVAADAFARGVPRLLRSPAGNVGVLCADAKGRLATGGSDGAVRLWDARTGAGRELGRQGAEVVSLRFSPDGAALASLGANGSIRLWDPAAGTGRLVADAGERIGRARFSPDGRTLYFLAVSGIRSCDLATGTLQRLPVHDFGSQIAVSPDGRHIAAAGLTTTVYLVDLAAGSTRELTGHTEDIRALVFSPDGRTLATAGGDKTIRLWDVAGGEARVLTGHADAINDLAYSPDGTHLASASDDHTVRVWDPATGDSVTLEGHTDAVGRVVFAPGGARLASASADRTVRVWDVAARTGRAFPVPHSNPRIAFLGDEAIAAAADAPEVRIWDLGGGGPAQVLATGLFALAVGGARAIGADPTAGKIRVWQLDTGKERSYDEPERFAETLAVAPGRGGFATESGGVVRLWSADGSSRVLPGLASAPLAFSPDGGRLAAAGKLAPTVLLWDVASGAGRALSGHTDWVTDLTFSPDGRLLASASRDHTVRLWDLERDEVRVLRGHAAAVTRVRFSSDGGTLASAGHDHTIRLWRLRTGAVRALSLVARARDLAFSPDGRLLAAGDGKDLRLWDVTGTGERKLPGHTSDIGIVRFYPDGLTLATADTQTVRVWDVASGESRVVRAAQGDDEIQSLGVAAGARLLILDGDELRMVPDDLPRDPRVLRARLAAAAAR